MLLQRNEAKMLVKLVGMLLVAAVFQLYSSSLYASQNHLETHVHYQPNEDHWQVNYSLPKSVNHITFLHQSNFDRTELYRIEQSKFKWIKADNELQIHSIDGSMFNKLTLTFKSDYRFIQKDYNHNIKFSDGSVLLYTNHFALDGNQFSSGDTQQNITNHFHFYAPKQHIALLGKQHFEQASWQLSGRGTYVYFGNIKPVENDNMIAIVDPALPKWVWQSTQDAFPKLFNYYTEKTAQALSFKPIVFFNYADMTEDYSNYNGGTLDGLVQLTINGQRWQQENKQEFNRLFHFLAHEAAHFWNGQMFTFEDSKHSWMHEGGADAFANFALADFGLIDENELLQRFESATNQCLLNKGKESLAQSAQYYKTKNFYSCGAAMAFASHLSIKAQHSNKGLFDLWKLIFSNSKDDFIYSQEDYFDALTTLTRNDKQASNLARFSDEPDIDNLNSIRTWFEQTELNTKLSEDYPPSSIRHWGKQPILALMKMQCNRYSLSEYNDYFHSYPIQSCGAFSKAMDIQYLNGIELLKDGVKAYKLFFDKCKNNEQISLQGRKRQTLANIRCTKEVKEITPHLTFHLKTEG